MADWDLARTKSMLAAVSGLDALSAETLDRIARSVTIAALARGEVLIRKGEAADALYIVLSGRFRVDNGVSTIAIVSAGEPLGELAFFSGGVRTANVTATRESEVLVLDRATYRQIASENPEITESILRAVAGRLSAVTPRSASLSPQVGLVIAVMPAAADPIPPAFIDALRSAAERRGGIAVQDETTAPVARSDAELRDWFIEQDRSGRRQLLLVRDPKKDSSWAEFVAARCDTVVEVGELSSPDRATGSVKPELTAGRHGEPHHLALWRKRSSDPIAATADWLGARNAHLHHHIALDGPRSFDRLIRFLCDEARGLVMAGGGAFGTAHIGAVRAFSEGGIDFDFVGGTSIGAAMAGAVALGIDPDEILRRTTQIFVTSRAMNRFTVPYHSILDHRVFDAQLQKHYGETLIEDLEINYFAVSASLTRNDLYVHRRGPLWQAVRASGSIPALLPPFLTEEGEVLIDGGVLDNAPLGVMRDLKAGPNLVMDFGVGRDWRFTSRYGDLPGRLGSARNFLQRPRAEKQRFPRISAVLTRTMVVNSRRLREQTDFGGDTLLLLPVAPRANFLDWKKNALHHDAAYQAVSAAFADTADPPRSFEALMQRLTAMMV